MLNKNRSNRKNSFKYALMLPLLAGFIFLFNIKTEAQIDPNPAATDSESSKKGNIQSLSDSGNDYSPITYDKKHTGDFIDPKDIESVSEAEYNPVTYDKEHTGDFPNYNLNSNDNLDDPNKILTLTKNRLPGIYVSDRNPLYVVDGKEISKTEFDKIDPNSIESISVWKGQRAINKYGKRGKDGVIEIILKKDYLNIPKTNYSDSLKIRTRGTNTNENKSGFDIKGATDPLYLLDGKEISKSDLDKIDPSTIESISVLKKESTIEVYGDKGKNGVVVIKTKSKWKVGTGLNSFNPKSTAMEYYQQMEKTAPSHLSLPDIDKALILLDGKPSSKKDLESITADQIKMLFPIAAGDKDAIKKYGDHAKNGVIEIITKKE